MNEYTVELSGDAQDDVVSIRDYIRDVLLNQSAASKFVSDTEKPLCPWKSSHTATWYVLDPNYSEDLRSYRDNYVMFYVIVEESKLVRVIKIAYAPSDLSDE